MGSMFQVGALLLAASAALQPVPLPSGAGGIGFDDLRYSPEQRKLLVPAGRTGLLDLLDPRTLEIQSIRGFSAAPGPARGHAQGTTSADSGDGLLFAADRTRRTLHVVDPALKRSVAQVALRGGPDYVRWVAPLHEVWVSEPSTGAIEMFRLEAASSPRLARIGKIDVVDGPESLEIDAAGRRAYANTWHDRTLVIDLDRRTIVARFHNGCQGARGLAVDPDHGLAFVGCEEGKAVALDLGHDGKIVGSARTGRGVDVIAFSQRLSHLYVPAQEAGDLAVIAVSALGELDVLATIPTAPGAHCVAADDAGNAFVCDPEKGRILVLRDGYDPPE